jgi:hypothetical protein
MFDEREWKICVICRVFRENLPAASRSAGNNFVESVQLSVSAKFTQDEEKTDN